MKVVSITVPVEVWYMYEADFVEATYCPNTQTMCLPIRYFSALMNHPVTTILVNDVDADVEINVCDDD